MEKNQLKDFYDYHAWANSQIFNRLKELPEEMITLEMTSAFPTIAKVLVHLYFTDSLWLGIMSGKSMKEGLEAFQQKRAETELKPLSELEALYEETAARYKSLLEAERDFNKQLVVENPYAGPLKTTIAETIFHIVTHGSYHRGNIAAMLRQQGQASVMQDFGLYLYAGKQKTP